MAQQCENVEFPGWEVVRKLGEGSFGSVYEIHRSLPGGQVEKCALKKLTVPRSNEEIEELYSRAFRKDSITAYYKNQMGELVSEYSMMQSLNGCPNIVNCHDIRYIQHDDNIGWDIYIRMELLHPLKRVINGEYNEQTVCTLGIQICNALIACHGEKIVHRDIKPENIMVSDKGVFKLGDFGVAKVVEKTGIGTMTGTNGYMAPEVAHHQPYGVSVDIYSLGLVLYWMMNERTLPFLPMPPQIPTGLQRQEAAKQRFAGESIPAPKNGSNELKRIVLKACAFSSEKRYSTALEMSADLQKCLRLIEKTEDQIPQQPYEDDDTTVCNSFLSREAFSGVSRQEKRAIPQKRFARRNKLNPIFLLGILCAFVLLGVVLTKNMWIWDGMNIDGNHEADIQAETVLQEEAAQVPAWGVMRADDVSNGYSSEGVPLYAFDTDILRDDVRSITFLNTFEAAPDDAWDISEMADGSVLAWVTRESRPYDMYIAGEGGVTAPQNCTTLFAFYSNVTEIIFNGCFDTSNATIMKAFFAGDERLNALKLEDFNTSQVTDMTGMFMQCRSLTSLDLSPLDTSNVTAMDYLFCGCGKLTSLKLEGINTAQVTSMRGMFYECGSLVHLDLNCFHTSKVTSMEQMFYSCNSLEILKLASFDTSNVTSMKEMFGRCKDLSNLDLSNFSTSHVSDMSGMFIGCARVETFNLGRLDYSNVTSYEQFMDPDVICNGRPWKALFTHNVMKADNVKPALTETGDFISQPVFGTGIMRDEVRSITFLDATASAPDDAWDISRDGNGSVLAWVTGENSRYDLYIAGEGGVEAPDNCEMLFALYSNVEFIHFGTAFDTSHVTRMTRMFMLCQSMKELDVSSFRTEKVESMVAMFGYCRSLEKLDLSSFDTSNVLNMGYMFDNCLNLTNLNLQSFNTSNVTSMTAMFEHCEKLPSLDLSSFNTSRVTDMSLMFIECHSLTSLNLENFDTAQVTNMKSMFDTCKKLTNLSISNFNTSQVTNMLDMFYNCPELTSLDLSNFDTSNVESMAEMFAYCRNLIVLNVEGFNTAKVISMASMFQNCSSLASVNLSSFDTSSVLDMSGMFGSCQAMTTLNLSSFNTAQVQSMSAMFYGCENLTALNLGGFDTSSVTDMSYMFLDCDSLADLDLRSFDFSNVTQFANFMNIGSSFNGLPWQALFGAYQAKNVMKSDDPGRVLDGNGELIPAAVFGQSILRDQVISITFLSTQKNAPENAWDISQFSDGTVLAWVTGHNGKYDLTIAANGTITAPMDCSKLFAGYPNVTEIRFNGCFDTSLVTQMDSMFQACKSLEYLDLSGVNTTGVASMNGMFADCPALTSLDLTEFDTSNVRDMSGMFYGDRGLHQLNLGSINTSNVTDMNGMFTMCENLQSLDLSSFETAKVKDMSLMFAFCSQLVSIDLSSFDTANVTDMSGMFGQCTKLRSLSLSNFDTRAVTTMRGMFGECKSLIELDLSSFQTLRVTDMSGMFMLCRNLVKLDVSSFDTSQVTDMSMMFVGCSRASKFELSSFDFSNVTDYEAFMDENVLYNGNSWEQLFA